MKKNTLYTVYNTSILYTSIHCKKWMEDPKNRMENPVFLCLKYIRIEEKPEEEKIHIEMFSIFIMNLL